MPERTPVMEVDRTTTTTTAIVHDDLGDLAEGQVRFRVDRFAVTANTVTYALFGALLGYWDFYPTRDPAFGRVPAMGWGDVVASAHPEVATGMRCYGWFPMAGHVDLTVSPTDEGLRDDGPHRQAHAPVYRAFQDATRDPLAPTSEDPTERGDLEDRHALLRGLFLTGFLADAFLDAEDWFGAETAIVLSASSKTGIAFAHQAAQRGLGSLVGVTSVDNVEFVTDLGIYSDVVTYDEVGSIPVTDAVAVDMAGNGPAIAALHEHLGDRLAHSMVVGRSHNDAPTVEVTAGPTPELFFAPTAMSRIPAGPGELQAAMATALEAFIADSTRWLTVERTAGPEATEATWAQVHAGAVPPHIGRITSLHD